MESARNFLPGSTSAWIAAILLLSTIVGCNRNEDPVEEKPSAPANEVMVSPTPAPAPVALGNFVDFTPEVGLRRGADWVWKGIAKGLPVFPLDAVRTELSGKAKIAFVDGTTLEIGEDSLVILRDRMKRTNSIDRAVARHGTVRGQTTREFWILTSAALFRLKATKDGKAGGRATLSVREGKHLKVVLESGEAEVVGNQTKQGKSVAFRARVPLRQPVILNAPSAPQDFGTTADESAWAEPARVELVNIQEVAVVPTPAPIPYPVREKPQRGKPASELLIVWPRNHAEVHQETVELQGQAPVPGEVRVNGKVVPVAPDGSFTTPLTLKPGANSFFVEWVPKKGPTKFKNWMLIRK